MLYCIGRQKITNVACVCRVFFRIHDGVEPIFFLRFCIGESPILTERLIRMSIISWDIPSDASSDFEQSYFEYKLSVSKQHIRSLIFIIAAFNLFLIVPDLMNIQKSSIFVILVIRILYSALLIGLYYQLKKIRSFQTLCCIVTSFELFAELIFLYVLSQYANPDIFIQTLGIITITIAVFLIPNRLVYAIGVSLFGAACYIAYLLLFTRVGASVFSAAIVYLCIDIALCAIFAKGSDKHQYNEFAAKSKLEQMSGKDHLTMVSNRHKLESDAITWIGFCRRHQLPLSLVFMDVDGLKQVNDTYGHLIGDSVLIDLSRLIADQSRKEDIIARWGGDEFVLMLPCIKLFDAVTYSERIRKAIVSNESLMEYGVTCSFGVVEMKKESTFDDLIRKADILLYEAKCNNKNNVRWSA